MEWVTMLELQYIIVAVCMIGCGYTSFKIGHQAGIVSALDYLEENGVIVFDED